MGTEVEKRKKTENIVDLEVLLDTVSSLDYFKQS